MLSFKGFYFNNFLKGFKVNFKDKKGFNNNKSFLKDYKDFP
jgi:hypothetical protein